MWIRLRSSEYEMPSDNFSDGRYVSFPAAETCERSEFGRQPVWPRYCPYAKYVHAPFPPSTDRYELNRPKLAPVSRASISIGELGVPSRNT